MKTQRLLFVILMLLPVLTVTIFSCQQNKKSSQLADDGYSGSGSCRECHEDFYKLWAPSHHGLAMQPITSAFINDKILLDQDEIFMEEAYYKAIAEDTLLYIQEKKGDEIKQYHVLWALGGKNVYYFLTPWEGGRLQTLPLAYNVNTKKWYNNPESAIRHFPHMGEETIEDQALSWRDLQYTFNTSCYGCHVSQLSNNFDLASNSYETHWKEPGINCETCHGPSAEHVRVCREAGEGNVPEDLKIIITSTFTPEQHNASCAPCHAKMRPITESFMPGDRYFDNYDLITLENTDFYPDGRDLGENYTMTGWHMNPCITKSDMHCVTCHTSSGRYRFKSDKLVEANKACTMCHEEKEEDYEEHTRHPINKNSPKCIDCHMPKTWFGHMERSDHSFRPPMPSATIKFKSPNACNLCHEDKDAKWADEHVRSWHKEDYQKETLYIAGLVNDARNNEWKRLDEMLKAIQTNKYGEVFTTSLLRLLANCANDKKWETILEALKLESPLSRSAAATSLLGYRNENAKQALFAAAKDEYRLVRLAAATSLTTFPLNEFTAQEQELFNKVNIEYEKSLVTRPDSWSAHYNLGNHLQNQGKTTEALASYENSIKLYPEAIMPLINSSFLYAVNGQQNKAVENLQTVLEIDSLNEAANLNYGLLMAELQNIPEAEKAMRNVLKVNDKNATAAYNLSIMVAEKSLDEACTFSHQAMEADPSDPKFPYTHAFFLNQNKKQAAAVKILKGTIKKHPSHLQSVFLLGSVYLESGNKGKTLELYRKTLQSVGQDQQASYQLQQAINQVEKM